MVCFLDEVDGDSEVVDQPVYVEPEPVQAHALPDVVTAVDRHWHLQPQPGESGSETRTGGWPRNVQPGTELYTHFATCARGHSPE